MDTKKSFKDSIVRAVALLGLLLVLMLGAWGIILLALNIPFIAGNVGNSIVSLFTSGTSSSLSSITVSAPETIKSGSSFVISWVADNSDSSYNYTISYTCKDGLSIKAPMPTGSYQTIACATPFNFVNASAKMTLIANVTGSTNIPATIVVSAAKSGSDTVIASGSTIVTVTTATANKPAATIVKGTSYAQPAVTYIPATTVTQSLYGSADLSVRILSINSLNSVQGRVAVQFEVSNVGTNVAPAGWAFTANLPVGYSYLYTSPVQQALNPGDKIIFTLGFNPANQNQYCTQQYPNQNCPWYQQPYQPYPYQGTCYRYDGYQNMPIPCTDSNGSPIYINQGYNNAYNNGSNYGYVYNGNLVTITVDPRNYVFDLNRYNNTASIASPIY